MQIDEVAAATMSWFCCKHRRWPRKLISSPGFLDRHAGLVAVIRHHLLTLLTLVAVIVGIGSGFVLRNALGGVWSVENAAYVAFPGELFLRLLNCLILPLVSSSLISSLGSLDLALSGRLAFHCVVYCLVTTPCAIGLGVILVTAIRPGVYPGSKNDTTDAIYAAQDTQGQLPLVIAEQTPTLDTILDLFRNIIPDNIVASCFSQYVTVRVDPKLQDGRYLPVDVANKSMSGEGSASYEARESRTQGTNVLGVIMFCILLGVSVGRLKDKGRPVALFFTSLFEAIMGLIRVIIWLSPIAVLFLVCSEILQIRDIRTLVDQIGLYCATVLVGLILHGFFVIPTAYFVITRSSPFRFLWNQAEALSTAFAAGSSAASMPVSIRCLEEYNGIHPKVARFVMPIGINMQGTALFEVVAVLFIAQMHGLEMNAGNVIVVSVTSAFGAVGAAGLPQAGLVTMVMVLNSVSLPAKYVSLIVVVDWILDRFRTLVNVICNSVGVGIVDHMSRAELERWESLATFCNNTPPIPPLPPLRASTLSPSKLPDHHLYHPPRPPSRRTSTGAVYVDILAFV